MDQIAAWRLLDSHVRTLQETPYARLISCIGKTISDQVEGKGKHQYTIESAFTWADTEQITIRIDLMTASADTGPLDQLDKMIMMQRG